jgi:SAM-dependent methyltransferase
LPLASLGHEVTARDLSGRAIERLQREAAARQLTIDAAVADMRAVADAVRGPFDAVIAFDNSLPHLLDDAAIAEALRGFVELLAPCGTLLVSVRDYDNVDRAPLSVHPYGERARAGRRFRLWQEWSWVDALRYRTALVIAERVGDDWIERVRTDALYYAVPIYRIIELMCDAGLRDCSVSEIAFFQPVLVGRKAGRAGSGP